MEMISFASHEPDLRLEIDELKKLIASKERDNAKVLGKAQMLDQLMIKYENEIRTETDLVREIENKCNNLERQSTDLLKSKLQMKQMKQMNQDRLRDLGKRTSKTLPPPPTSTPSHEVYRKRTSNPLFSLSRNSTAAGGAAGASGDVELSRKMRELSELGTEYQAKEIRLHEKRLQNQALRAQLTSSSPFDHGQPGGESSETEADGNEEEPFVNLEDSLD
ncbi:hypothetical protein BASA81_012509 [Batrachochytrium salamandrivorans]|nr:hypothetical protein BASA81_012509 [Batrachochytrium salamandrivorans]